MITDERIEQHKKNIDKLSQEEMASLWRFAPSGHIYFRSDLPLSDYFKERFNKLGGFNPEISKKIGWEG